MRRPSFALLPLLLTLLAHVDFAHAEKTRFDLTQLKAPPGFHISVFAEVDGPRMMVFSPGGVLLATESSEGKVIALPDFKHAGKAERSVTVLSGLNEPHGLAFYEGKLYVAENDKVRRYDWDEANLRASNPKALANLPDGGGHSTRSLVFHGGKLYVSAGSSCNVCIEKDSRRAAVMEFNPDGSGQKIFAKEVNDKNRVIAAFGRVITETKKHFSEDPILVRELRLFVRDGEWEEDGEKAVASLKKVTTRKVFLRKLEGRWFMEERQQ